MTQDSQGTLTPHQSCRAQRAVLHMWLPSTLDTAVVSRLGHNNQGAAEIQVLQTTGGQPRTWQGLGLLQQSTRAKKGTDASTTHPAWHYKSLTHTVATATPHLVEN